MDDRKFVITDGAGRVLTQKTFAKLNLISAKLTSDLLCLAFPGKPAIRIDLKRSGPPTEVNMYGTMPGECMGADAAAWLSDALGRDCRLVRSNVPFTRNMGSAAHLFLPVQQRYPDASPIHLILCGSLDDLVRRVGHELAAERFRPNIVIEGGAAYEEDRFRRLRIGEVVLEYMGPCERCGVPNVMPGTAKRQSEPLRTLATYRTMKEGFMGGIIFGAFFRPTVLGTIHVDRAVEVLEQGSPLDFQGDR